MGKVKNEIGNTYHNLTVIEQSPIKKDGKTQWVCQCKCGNIVTVLGTSLRSGNTKSCGCLLKYKEIGKKYNKLTIVKYSHTGERGDLIWECLCDCGNTTFVRTGDLKSGHTKSCGCLYSPDLTGQQFGQLVVLERSMKGWKCRCSCGNEVTVSTGNLKSGNTSSCGCINYSIGEANIVKWLNKNNIFYKKEWIMPNSLLRFDFALFDNNHNLIMLIEFDGEQHFTERKGIWKHQDSFQDIKYRDKMKNDFAIKNHIPLVRIPYWERNNISTQTIFNPTYFIAGTLV